MTPDGKKTAVVFSAHMFCGELFIYGAVTPKDQKGEIKSAWGTWKSDYDRLSPTDKKEYHYIRILESGDRHRYLTDIG